MSSGYEQTPVPVDQPEGGKSEGSKKRLSAMGILTLVMGLILFGAITLGIMKACSAPSAKSLVGSYSLVGTTIAGMKSSSLELKEGGDFKLTLFVGDYEEMTGRWGIRGESSTIDFFNIKGTSSSSIKIEGEASGNRIVVTGTEKGKTFEITYEKIKYQSQ